MANFPNYPLKTFSSSQNFLARNPAGSGEVERVQGQSILDAAVAEILNRGDIVQAVDTLTEAIANDYASGIYVLTGGNAITLDGGQAIYRVSDPGSGGIAMANGNELVLLFVANTPANIVTPLNSIADFYQFTGSVDGQQVSVTGYHPDSTVGGESFAWSFGRHDGVIFFDPARNFPSDWGDEAQKAAWYADSGIDVPCWERVGVDKVNVFIGGAKGNDVDDDTQAINKCLDIADQNIVYFPQGRYIVSSKLNITRNHFNIQGSRRGSLIRANHSDWVFEYAQANPARWCNFSDLVIRDDGGACLGAFRGVSMWESNIERIGCLGFSYTTDINDPYAGAAAIQIETGPYGAYWNTIDSLTVSGGMNVGVRLVCDVLGNNAVTISNSSFLGGADADQNPASHTGYVANVQGNFNKGFGVVANTSAGSVIDCNAVRVENCAFEKLKEGINWQVFGSQMINPRFEKNNIDVQHNTSREITGVGENNGDVAYDTVRVPVIPSSSDFGGRGAFVDSDTLVESLNSADIKSLVIFENVSTYLGSKRTDYKLDITLDCETVDNGRPLGSGIYATLDIYINGAYDESYRINTISYLSVAGQTKRETASISLPVNVQSTSGSVEVRLKAGFAASIARVYKTRIMLTAMHTFDTSITVTAP